MAEIHTRAAQMLRGEIQERAGSTKAGNDLLDILQVIALDTGRNGQPAKTGVRTIAERAGCAPNTVGKRTDLLQKMGYIRKEKHGRGFRYHILFVTDCQNEVEEPCENQIATKFATVEYVDKRLSQIEAQLSQILNLLSQNNEKPSQRQAEIGTEDGSLEERRENARACDKNPETPKASPPHLDHFVLTMASSELIRKLRDRSLFRFTTRQIADYGASIAAALQQANLKPEVLDRFPEYVPHNPSLSGLSGLMWVSQVADHMDDFIAWLTDPERQAQPVVTQDAKSEARRVFDQEVKPLVGLRPDALRERWNKLGGAVQNAIIAAGGQTWLADPKIWDFEPAYNAQMLGGGAQS